MYLMCIEIHSSRLLQYNKPNTHAPTHPRICAGMRMSASMPARMMCVNTQAVVPQYKVVKHSRQRRADLHVKNHRNGELTRSYGPSLGCQEEAHSYESPQMIHQCSERGRYSLCLLGPRPAASRRVWFLCNTQYSSTPALVVMAAMALGLVLPPLCSWRNWRCLFVVGGEPRLHPSLGGLLSASWGGEGGGGGGRGGS